MFSTGTWLTICSLLYPPRPIILCVVVAAHILAYNVHQVGQNCIPQLFHSADKHFCLTLPAYLTLLVKVVHVNDRYLHDCTKCCPARQYHRRNHWKYQLPEVSSLLPRLGGWGRRTGRWDHDLVTATFLIYYCCHYKQKPRCHRRHFLSRDQKPSREQQDR